jgi:hypothetical protein
MEGVIGVETGLIFCTNDRQPVAHWPSLCGPRLNSTNKKKKYLIKNNIAKIF